MRANEARTETCALDIEVFWGERDLLHTEHLCPAEPYYLRDAPSSHRGPHFLVNPDWIGGEERTLVSIEGELVIVHGESEDIPLRLGDEAQVSIGPLCFRIYVVAPTPPLAAAELDSKSHLWTFASLSAHALALLCMAFMPPKASSLSLDLISQDDRYVRYLATPIETQQELPWSEDVGQLGSGEAHDDARAHRGDEGQAGKPEARARDARMAISGNDRVRAPAKSAAEQARQAGILGVLSAAAYAGLTSSFDVTAPLGYDPSIAQGAIFGAQIGENFAFNGIGMRGTGRFGGGDVGDTIGVGTLKTGQAASGSPGTHTLTNPRREARVPSGLRVGPVETTGSLSKEAIRRVIQRHLNEVRFCYEEGLRAQPDLSGRVAVRFMVSPAGVVQHAQVADSELRRPTTEVCIVSAVRRWTFPAPEGGGYVTVSYPFLFDRPE